MKKVQVLVGSLGVAAPILAMMTPAPTLAATHATDQPAKSGGKPVRVLGASGTTAAQAAATSSSSSMLGASPSAGNGASPGIVPCDGVKKYKKTKNMESLTFWSGYLNGTSACIGTIEGKWFAFPDNPYWLYHVKIYSHGNWTKTVYNKKTGGDTLNSNTVYGQQGVHKYYHLPIRVCTTWYHSTPDSPGSIAILCRTIT